MGTGFSEDGADWRAIEEMMSALEIVTSFYNAIGKGDAAVALSLLAPTAQWTEAIGSRYYGGTWIGPEAVRRNLLERLGADWSSFVVTPDLYVSEGPHVVAFGIYKGTARAATKALAAPFAHHWEVADGSIICFRQFTDTALWDDVFKDSEK